MDGGEEALEPRLHGGGVLIFIDQDLAQTRSYRRPDVVVIFEELDGPAQQVVISHQAMAPLIHLVIVRERPQCVLKVDKLRIVGLEQVAQRGPTIPHRREHRLQRSEEHTSELQSRGHLVCRLLLEKKKTHNETTST